MQEYGIEKPEVARDALTHLDKERLQEKHLESAIASLFDDKDVNRRKEHCKAESAAFSGYLRGH